MTKQWNIQALELDLPNQLANCRSDFERNNVKALHGMEIRQLATQLASEGKLSPAARAIASKYGF